MLTLTTAKLSPDLCTEKWNAAVWHTSVCIPLGNISRKPA